MKVIGITGGIGAGKTYVSHQISERYGFPTYNCDTEAKRLTIQSPEIREKLIALLGADVYTTDGLINKPVLANYLFGNKQNAERINGIIHPVVRQDFLQWKEEKKTNSSGNNGENVSAIMMESAILMESHFDELCDEIILVTAPLEMRIERACKRDNATTEAIAKRIKAQLSDEERAQMADKSKTLYTVLNDGTQLDHQLQTIFKTQK